MRGFSKNIGTGRRKSQFQHFIVKSKYKIGKTTKRILYEKEALPFLHWTFYNSAFMAVASSFSHGVAYAFL